MAEIGWIAIGSISILEASDTGDAGALRTCVEISFGFIFSLFAFLVLVHLGRILLISNGDFICKLLVECEVEGEIEGEIEIGLGLGPTLSLGRKDEEEEWEIEVGIDSLPLRIVPRRRVERDGRFKIAIRRKERKKERNRGKESNGIESNQMK